MDADTAKANPAPQPDSILRDALTALAAPASPAPPTGATNFMTLDPAAPAVGDGRAVAVPAGTPSVAARDETTLGRFLTRAMLNDPSPTAPAAPLASGELRRTAANAPQPVVNASALATADGASSSASTALDAFLGAFASELARTDANATRHEGQSAPAVAGAAPLAPNASNQTPSLPFTLAVASGDTAQTIVPTPPAPAVPQPQHADANAVVEQILRGMAIRTTDGQSEVRLRLVPESLGDVSVKLIVSGGSVDASLVAHTADAQSALAGGAHQLAKTLADAGLKLQSFTVGLAGGNFADARDQSRQNGAWTRPNSRRIGGVEAVDADVPDDALLAVPSFGPPIYTASTLPGALNYLA